MQEKIRVGVSSCLLGEKVRYDGGHKHDRFITQTLGEYVDFVGVCPEVECGLSTPREAMRLVGKLDNPKLLTQKTEIDYTVKMHKWAKKRVAALAKEGLCGFIFKTGSPSSGMRDIKVYNAKGCAVKKGVGLFAKTFMDAFPLLPVEDDGRLHDMALRENFIERVFVFKRWQDMCKKGKKLKNLMDFHTRHKLLIMAHSPAKLREIGTLMGTPKAYDINDLFSNYIETLMPALKLQATVKKNTNVLHHIFGYFKKNLSSEEKQEALEVIEKYHSRYVPLMVPMVLLQHYVRKYKKDYLSTQYYLNPHPIELMLRNHV